MGAQGYLVRRGLGDRHSPLFILYTASLKIPAVDIEVG